MNRAHGSQGAFFAWSLAKTEAAKWKKVINRQEFDEESIEEFLKGAALPVDFGDRKNSPGRTGGGKQAN